jgi:hypothetical protein
MFLQVSEQEVITKGQVWTVERKVSFLKASFPYGGGCFSRLEHKGVVFVNGLLQIPKHRCIGITSDCCFMWHAVVVIIDADGCILHFF